MLVDSASSQKINSTLRWLVNNHGTLTGNQAIVVWAIKRPEEKPVLNPQSGSFDFDDFFSPIADESKALHDDISDALNATNVQYAKIFSRVLRGYEGAEDLKKHNDPMVVVILDAATTGRLGVTFYCELQKDEYIKRILQWHVDAAWPLYGEWNMGYMFHGFSYPDENPDHNLISRFWTPIMEDGVIRFESPDSPLLDRHIVRHGLNVKEFNLGKNVTSAEEE